MDSTPTTSSWRIIGVDSRVRKPVQPLQVEAPVVGVVEDVGDLVGAACPRPRARRSIDRLRAIGCSSRCTGGIPRVSRRRRARDGTRRRPTRNSCAAAAPHRRAAYSRTVSRTAPGFGDVATERRENLAGSPPTARARRAVPARDNRRRRTRARSCRRSLGCSTLPQVIVVHAPTWMRSPSASGISSPLRKRSSLSLMAGSVGRTQVGDGEPGVPDPQHGVLGGHAAVSGVDAEVDLGFDALFAVAASDQRWSRATA